MPNNLKHGRSKLISNYGGVGSLIETQGCSIIIETFDNWDYKDLGNRLSSFIIKDDRLLNRLKNRFEKLRHIVKIPTDKNSLKDQIQPKANYFSKWFYCTRCKRFAEYSEWLERWNATGKNKDFFNPPKCSNADCKEEVLEQIRFVMTCKDGHIHDIPWKHWNLRLPTDRSNIEDEEGEDENEKKEKLKGPQLDLSTTCCGHEQDLRYEISKENTELSGIRIKCEHCNKTQTLKGIFNYERDCEGKKYWLGMENGSWINEICEQKTKVVVKTSNSVYYANTLSSIFIPKFQLALDEEKRLRIERLLDKGNSAEEVIKKMFEDDDVPKEITKQYLNKGEVHFIPEEEFRKTEYDYLLNDEQPEDKQLRFRLIECSQISGFAQLVKIDKLKKITVQSSFTRQEPIDTDSILIDEKSGEYPYSVTRQSVSKNNFKTQLLPGIESYGEGILFVLDKEKLNSWESQQEVIDRTLVLRTNANHSSWQYHKIIARTLTPRKVLIHTLSHLLIRELEYVCGYPASSLQERLYVSDTMHGFLISAFDGTDGYLGGLANLCNDLDKLNEIIESAINRANDCSSDPICMQSEGQGVSQLNLAACHSCTLIPEVACELSNLFLDRHLLVNEEVGYFKDRLAKEAP